MSILDAVLWSVFGASIAVCVKTLINAIGWRLAKRKADAIEAKLRRVGLML